MASIKNKKMDMKINIKGDNCCGHGHMHHCGSCGGAVYGLGFLGAAIYYITTSTSFWMGVWGVIKALVWPAILAFHLFQYLKI